MRASWIMRCKTPDGKVMAGTVSWKGRAGASSESRVKEVLLEVDYKLYDDGIRREESEDMGEEVLGI